MRVFIDGLDASGKSTFADMLHKKYGYAVSHSNGDSANDFEFFNSMFNDDNIVYDRCHVGELVYSNVYNRKSKLSMCEFNTLMKKLIDNKDILIIFTCSDMPIIYERLQKRREYEYFHEMPAQEFFYEDMIKYLKTKYRYDRMFFVDIAKKDAYVDLENLIDNIISNEVRP